MKHLRIAVVVSLVALVLVGCHAEEDTDRKKLTNDRQLYSMGLDVISVMDEMMQSDSYGEIMGASGVQDTLEMVDTNDYDSPLAVYSITMPDTEELLKLAINNDMDLWQDLSEKLKEQVENRVSFSVLVSLLNGRSGSKNIAFSSLYMAFVKNEKLKLKETKIFLYVFEEGTPIVVTFSESGTIQGQFLFLENVKTLSDVREVFEAFDCSVSRVDID